MMVKDAKATIWGYMGNQFITYSSTHIDFISFFHHNLSIYEKKFH